MLSNQNVFGKQIKLEENIIESQTFSKITIIGTFAQASSKLHTNKHKAAKQKKKHSY